MGSYLNLQEIDQEQALNLTKFFIRSQQNIFIFGRKGVGKTHIAMQAAQECNFKINYINLSVVERTDLAGYPDLMSQGDVVSFKSPYYLPTLKDKEKADSIILFDEVDKAPPEVTAPLLEILQFRKINGKKINAVGCILTGNLLNEHVNSNLISSALLDRGSKYILSFNFDKWIDWAKANSIHDLILGFLKNNTEFCCSTNTEYVYASPSPRSWTLASDALFKARDLKLVDIDTITQIISGFVGNEAGLRFKIWYEHYRKFEPIITPLIENGLLSIDLNNLLPTEKIIFVITACYFAKQKTLQNINKQKNKFLYLENLCDFLNNYNIDAEMKVMALNNSFDFDMIAKHKLYSCKKFFDVFTRLNENISIKST